MSFENLATGVTHRLSGLETLDEIFGGEDGSHTDV